MSQRSSRDSEQKTVPLGIVLFVVGFIILGTVVAIWIAMPALMPQPVYVAVKEFLPENISAILPTRAAAASVPPAALLPESPSQQTETSAPTEDELPSYFVSAETAPRKDALPGEPVQIVIPKINLGAPISKIGLKQVNDNGQTYFQWQVPNKFEAGWHNNSARLGETGNTVLNGHHNIYGEVFRNLIDLEEGDEIILYDPQQAYTYQVIIKEILPERGESMTTRIANAQWIAPTNDERITLITCWPYTDNSHRLVIVAKPVK